MLGLTETRVLLAAVADAAAGRPASARPAPPPDLDRLAAWLSARGLAAAAYPWARRDLPALVPMLRAQAMTAAAGHLARSQALAEIEARFASDGIPLVLLKGAALATAAYADPSYRPMTDLDLWVPDDDVPRAGQRLVELGYRPAAEVPGRPAALQRRSGGEAAFTGPAGLVELHYSAFQGWWVRRAAAADASEAWRRAVPVAPGRHARRLAHEDGVVQVAFHVVVNQFSQSPMRGLLDLAVMARALDVDWGEVARRARRWRLARAVGLVLETADALYGLPGAFPAAEALRATGARRALIRRFVTPESVLRGRDLTRPLRRHAFLLSLTDRPAGAARVVGRTLWPEPWWREARYGRPVGPVAHLLSLLRRGHA